MVSYKIFPCVLLIILLTRMDMLKEQASQLTRQISNKFTSTTHPTLPNPGRALAIKYNAEMKTTHKEVRYKLSKTQGNIL